MQRHVMLVLLFLSLTLLAAGLMPGAGLAQAQTGERCFAETGYCISGPIRAFWEQNGSLPVFGLPLGPQQELPGEDGVSRQTQWFERARLELHPENPAPYNVLLGRLAVERLAQQGRDWRAFPALNPNDADAERCAFFRATSHQVCDEFLRAFRSFGLNFPNTPGISFEESLALFGLPISEPLTEIIEGKEYTVQWFERARFELHPENQPPANVLFGRLGAELAAAQDGAELLRREPWQLETFGPLDAPEVAKTERPATLSFEAERVSGFSGCNNFGGAYQATADTISFGPLISTLAACTDDVLTRQEREIYSALTGTVAYTIANGRLRISYDEGRKQLTYRAESVPASVVDGTVTYLQRIALPPEAVIQVQLVDVSRADAPAIVLATTSFQAGGRQVPFAFALPYDPARIDERYTYAVQARITLDGQLRFISTERYAVITRGNPTTVEVIVRPVSS